MLKHSVPPLGLMLVLGLTLCVLTACVGTQTDQDRPPPVFFPAPPGTPRLQFLRSVSGGGDLGETSSFRQFVIGDEKATDLTRPAGIDWHDGALYVCDPGQKHVMVIDFRENAIRPLSPENPGIFRMPVSVAVAPDGKVYVADSVHGKVLEFEAGGRFLRAFGKPGTWRPVSVDATGDRLYVTDTAAHVVVVLDRSSGGEILRIGKRGNGEAEFFYPVAVHVAPGGDVYVTDSFNYRVQRLTPDGEFMATWGSIGDQPGQFARPRGLAVDREGRTYVADGAYENVQLFDDQTRLLLFFGGAGGAPGATNMPTGITVSYDAVPWFQDLVAQGREIEYVVFISNQVGPAMVNAYGLLRQE